MEGNCIADHGQAEAAADIVALIFGGFAGDAVESLEDPVKHIFRDTGACVIVPHLDFIAGLLG